VKFNPQLRLRYEIAQLRHAYAQLKAGHVTNHEMFAVGMIGPIIQDLERIADKMEDRAG